MPPGANRCRRHQGTGRVCQGYIRELAGGVGGSGASSRLGGVRGHQGPAGVQGNFRAGRGIRGVRGIGWLHMKYDDGLLQSTLENSRWSIADNRTWDEINWTKVSTILGHQIALQGGLGVRDRGTSDKTSACWSGWWHVMLTCSNTTLDH